MSLARFLNNVHVVSVANLNSENIRHVGSDATYEKTKDIMKKNGFLWTFTSATFIILAHSRKKLKLLTFYSSKGIPKEIFHYVYAVCLLTWCWC